MTHRLSRRLRARSHITLCNTRARFIPQSDPNLGGRERERKRGGFASRPRCWSHLIQMKRNWRWVPVRETIGTVPRRWVTNDLVEEERGAPRVHEPLVCGTSIGRGMHVASYLRFPDIYSNTISNHLSFYPRPAGSLRALQLSPMPNLLPPPNFN